MKKEILYTVAKTSDGLLIKAIDAEKDQPFFCPVCNENVILRKSGKTGKNRKRPHFAHRELTPNCTPETALHYTFKNLLYKKIQDLLNNNEPLPFEWECQYCRELHTGNVLKKASQVRIEHYMEVCQPDIALLDENNKVHAVVEVVVSHKPDEAVLKYYKENNIILIQINLESDRDIDNLDDRISHPNIVTTCFNPKCSVCGSFQVRSIMWIVQGSCWKCGKTMKIAAILGDMNRDTTTAGPSEFSDKELALARSKGALIKQQYSKTAGSSYLGNSCPHCGSLTGDFYLFQDFVSLASYGDLPYEEFDIGFHCEVCADRKYLQQEEDDDNQFEMN